MDTQALSVLLQQYADQLGDIPTLTTTLNTASITKTDNTEYTTKGIAKKLSDIEAATAYGILEAASAENPLLRSILTTISTIGLDFSDPTVRGYVDTIVAPIDPTLADKLKELGEWQVTPYEDAGGSGNVSEADVTSAANMLQTREWFEGAAQDIVTAVKNGTHSTPNDCVVALEALKP